MSTVFDSFHRFNVGDDAFIAGPARFMWAGSTIAMPTTLATIVNMSTFDPMTDWNDLGATKSGVGISRNFTEQTYDIDQSYSDIRSRPTNWEMAVQTALAEMTLERIAFAWEGGSITTNTAPTPDERTLGLGAPRRFTQRRLAVLHVRDNDKLRAYILRKCQIAPQETVLQHQKEGDQQTLPLRFRALADSSIVDEQLRFGYVIDQV